MRHINIPIFVPHLGCPHTCVFCNQKTITGQTGFTIEEAENTVNTFLQTAPQDAEKEIAFFGGSFTTIERSLMISLLKLGKHRIDSGEISSLRLSTRPDAIDQEILTLLKTYGVKTIELGIQSTDDTVLSASERGHTRKDSERACRLIKENEFSLVGQMMLGLPQSNFEKEYQTAIDMIAWGIDAARIYPTVVFQNTSLEKLLGEAIYEPLTVEDAVERAALLIECFEKAHVEILRIGLCENEGLRQDNTIGGAYHAALGEMAYSAYFRRKLEKAIATLSPLSDATYLIEVAPKRLSQAIGQKQCNLRYLHTHYPHTTFLLKASPSVGIHEVRIHKKEN